MSDPKYKHIGSPEDRIMEECGEILQALGKGKRFGWDSYHPDTPGVSNLQQLSMEIDDIVEAFQDLRKNLIGATHQGGKNWCDHCGVTGGRHAFYCQKGKTIQHI